MPASSAMSEVTVGTIRDETNSANVVTLSFRQVAYKKRKWVATGTPVLELEVIGELHTLTDVGEKLFDCYLGDLLNECLYDHVWRFEVLVGVDEDESDGDMEEMELDSTTPILAKGETLLYLCIRSFVWQLLISSEA